MSDCGQYFHSTELHRVRESAKMNSRLVVSNRSHVHSERTFIYVRCYGWRMVLRKSGGKSVLIPVSPSASSIACIRSLGRRGIHTVCASEDESRPALSSRYCGEVIAVPSPHDDLIAYKDSLLRIASRPDVRTIISNREEDSYVLSKYKREFGEQVAALWPSFDQLRTVHDRLRLAEATEEAGVPTPGTWSFDEVDDWDRELIVKPRYSILTSEYVDSLSPRECEGKMDPVYISPGTEPDLEEIQATMHSSDRRIPDHVPIVQEIVRGTGAEYGFRGLYDGGKRVTTCQKRQLRGKSYAGGASVFRETMYDPRIDELGQRILEYLDWHGLASVQFLRDADSGEFKFTEINPRMWASLQMDVIAGADFPHHHWLLANGEDARIEDGYEIGAGNHLLAGELQYLLSVLRDDNPIVKRPKFRTAFWDVISSCYDQPNFDYLHVDDPGPFVRGILNQMPTSHHDSIGTVVERAYRH